MTHLVTPILRLSMLGMLSLVISATSLSAYEYRNLDTGWLINDTNTQFLGQVTVNSTLTTPAQIVSTLATGTAPFAISSSTIVANLNAQYLNGRTWSDSIGANTLVTRDASNYSFMYYINSSTSNDENPTLSQFITTNGSDNYYRKSSLSHVVNNIGAKMFNNMGLNHATYTDFNTPTEVGPRYIMGATNGPGISGATQYYNTNFGLGVDNAYTSYGMQFAIPRTPVGGNPYASVRYREAGAWGSWSKIYAGYADAVPWSGVSSKPTTISGYGITDALDLSSTQTITGIKYFLSNKGAASYLGANTSYTLQAESTDGGAAAMSFHRSGAYAVNMGLDPDNLFRIGGWSASSNRLELDMNGNLWTPGSMRSPIFYDKDNTSYYLDPASISNINSIRVVGDHVINNTSPTIYLQDTDNRAGMIHMNSNIFYILSANGTNSTTWASNGSYWPLTIDLTNDVTTFGGATSFMEGNVGIGVSGAGEKLEVAGNIKGTRLLAYGAGANSTNTAVGLDSLLNNTSGTNNTALGSSALYTNQAGYLNVGVGASALYYNTGGWWNVAVGGGALYSNRAGYHNIGIGTYALQNNINGYQNIAIGSQALNYNQGGSSNIGIGLNALYQNTNGYQNVAIGDGSLGATTTGYFNVSVGTNNMLQNITGSGNTAVGSQALTNANAWANTAVGFQSLTTNTGGVKNTAVGYQALRSNGTGYENTAVGGWALADNTSGYNNSSLGKGALIANTSGNLNTAMGVYAAGSSTTASQVTAVGWSALNIATGDQNTALGSQAGSNIQSGGNNIAIGYGAQINDPWGWHQIRMGNSSIGYAAIQVGWTVTSDRRFKKDIAPLPLGLDFINGLNPVEYLRKSSDEEHNIMRGKKELGFIAQDVEKLLEKFGYKSSGLITIDSEGYYSLRYNDFFAVLTKGIQELSKKLDGHTDEIDALRRENVTLKARLDTLEQRLNALEGK